MPSFIREAIALRFDGEGRVLEALRVDRLLESFSEVKERNGILLAGSVAIPFRGAGSNQRRRGFGQQRLRGVQTAAATACHGGGGSGGRRGGGSGVGRGGGGGSGLERGHGSRAATVWRRCRDGAAAVRPVSGGGGGGSPAVVAAWQFNPLQCFDAIPHFSCSEWVRRHFWEDKGMLIFQTLENHAGKLMPIWRVGERGWDTILVPGDEDKGWATFFNGLVNEDERTHTTSSYGQSMDSGNTGEGSMITLLHRRGRTWETRMSVT
ncbi:hypothetical protein Syun_023149 [Stephania yunnanensis]|uniref:Uncharacterized protein n=1 Tax=Stephania yunnanensis TaxID=152371 RepID=A0AAP0FLQ5_9MAGN